VALRPIESHTLGAIYKAYEQSAQEDQFESIGLSISDLADKECERALWFAFRMAFELEAKDGKKARLLDTAKLDQSRLIGDLYRAGIQVAETGSRVTALGGHLRGRPQGNATNVPEAPKAVHVILCSTKNEKAFKQIAVGVTSRKDGSVSKGVQEQSPSLYARAQIFMHLLKIERCLFVLENRGTSELHVERLKYDAAHGLQLMAKAERVITSNRAPAKISEDPAKYPCIMCPASSVCHGQAFGRNNCRTCIHSTPQIDDANQAARWHCARFDKLLTVEDQKAGCPAHLYLPDLVPGEQIDAGDDWVAYRMADGSTWRDGVTAEAAK